MIISSTITKKVLETIVHETFSTFGIFSSSSLLDSLKLLGFYYATNAGVSINIEDLKTPDVKKKFIETANQEIDFVSTRWQQGFVSDVERFQSIIDSWNVATEGLKNRIVDYYQYFDPANNLYIMAFSGARGNMSQVRQLVGMRGLMSDQNGKIIDLPIQRNFREGLSSIDYIVSSYGARKGIVDTALKTADSGYLTRRLIYLAQDLVIRETDCQSSTGVFLFLKKTSSSKNFVGRYLNWAKKETFPYEKIHSNNIFLDSSVLTALKKQAPVTLNVRSSLTCQSSASICQLCYGFDLAHNRVISLGETVGILAAQSIGEPGTQLTMRTFHTGGIFTGETIKAILSPFSGKIIFPTYLKTISYRTNHGVLVAKLQQEAKIKIVDWKGIEKEISLAIGSFLYITKSCFLPENALIAEYSTQSFSLGTKRMKPIYSTIDGEIILTMPIRSIPTKRIAITLEEGVLWVTFANIFPIPSQSALHFRKKLEKKKSFASLKVSVSEAGYIHLSENCLTLFTKTKTLTLELTHLLMSFKNCSVKILPIVKNYQYVDASTTVAFLYIQPKKDETIYLIRQKQSQLAMHKKFLNQNVKKAGKLQKLVTTWFPPDQPARYSEIRRLLISSGMSSENYNFFIGQKVKKIRKSAALFTWMKETSRQVIIAEKEKNLGQVFFVIAESDILKMNTDQVTSLSFSTKKKSFFRPKMKVNSMLQFTNCCYFLKKDGLKMIFQKALPTHLSANTMLKHKSGDFIYEKAVLAKLVNYTQQTEDIVQGLPKIEELIEARKAKQASILSRVPGVAISNSLLKIEQYWKHPVKKTVLEHPYRFTIQMPENIFSYALYLEKPKDLKSKKEKEVDDEEEIEEIEEEGKKRKKGKEKTFFPFLVSCHSFPEQFVVFETNIVNCQKLFKKPGDKNNIFIPKLLPPIFAPYEVPSNAKKEPKKVECNKKQFEHGYNYAFKVVGSELEYRIEVVPEGLPEKEMVELEEVREEEKRRRFEHYLRVKGRKSYSKFQTLPVHDYLSKKLIRYTNKEFVFWKKIVSSELLRSRTPDCEDDLGAEAFYRNSKKDLMLTIGKKEYVFLENVNFFKEYRLTNRCKPIVKFGDFIDIGEPITEGTIDTHSLLNILFEYHRQLDGTMQGTKRSVQKIQLILVNSIQAIYQSQGVNIASKHIEIVVKQMTSKVSIISGGNTPFLPGELVPFVLITQVSLALQDATIVSEEEFFPYHLPGYEPKILSATNASLGKDSFLSAAGFQETKRILSKAALEGSCDWLRGLKECIMLGRLIPAGSTFLNYKNYLDKAYSFLK